MKQEHESVQTLTPNTYPINAMFSNSSSFLFS